MKKEDYTELICKKFCSYYKPNKEFERCGGYFYLQDSLTPFEIKTLVIAIDIDKNEYFRDDLSFLCEKCDFREDGCDFVIDKNRVPCGGYLLISKIIDYFNLNE
ncbi:MAG: hypothetical protein ABDH16_02455 [Thermodesulfovibrionaceae bacterium]